MFKLNKSRKGDDKSQAYFSGSDFFLLPIYTIFLILILKLMLDNLLIN